MRKSFIDAEHPQLSIRRQTRLLRVNRNRLAPKAKKPRAGDLELCRAIDELHLERPFFGSRRIADELHAHGLPIGRKRTRCLMRTMGLVAAYPKPRTSIKSAENEVYPYLLRGLKVERLNQVWCADITYIPMRRGFGYLVVIMDWHSRAVLAWRISNTLDVGFCVEALHAVRDRAGTWPEIMNTDQGCQFTSRAWTSVLEEAEVRISMDGKGRWLDNVFVERLWRSLKYEDIYLREYCDLVELEEGVARWFDFYNHERRHTALGKCTPWSVWSAERITRAA